MAGAKGVRAGRASVELFADDSKLRRGLRAAQKRLKGFQSIVNGIGAKLLAGSAVVGTVLGAMVGKFASLGDQFDKISARTGVSVEMLSKLAHAANASGADIETLEKGLTGLGRFMVDLETGSRTAADMMGILGLSMDALEGKSPDERLKILLNAIAGIEDEGLRAGVALKVLGRSGLKLLPMAGSFEELAAQAEEFGIVMSQETAKKAAELTDAMGLLSAVLTMVKVQVGASLAPTLIKVARQISKISAEGISWVKRNREVIVTVAKLALGVAAAGAGFLSMGLAAAALSSILGLVSLGFGAIGTVIGVVVAVMGALVSPIGLVTAGIVALLAYFVDFGSLIEGATQAGSAAFSSFKDRALESWGAIRDAVGAGDLKTAFKIAALFLKAEWARVVSSMSGKWSQFTNFFQTVWSNAVFNAASVMTSQWADIQSIGVKTWDVIADAFSVFTSGLRKGWNSTVGFFKSAWSKLKATVTGSEDKSEEINKATREVNQQVDRDRDKAIVEREQERKSSLAGIESQRTAVQKELSSQQATADANREAALTAELAENQLAIDSAREELAASIKAAADKRAAEASAPEGEKAKQAAKVAEKSRGVTQKEEKTKSSVEGAFSVFQAVALGSGSSAEDRTAKATEETAKHAKATVRAVKDAAPTFA